MFRTFAAFALALVICSPVLSHEYWLEAEDYSISSSQKMQIGIFLGQNFNGNEFPYNPSQLRLYQLIDSAGAIDLDGQLGDKPSIQIRPRNSGLNIFANISSTSVLDYTEPGKFEKFVTDMGLDWVMEQHVARGLPEVGFREGYTRFVKTLVSVDGGAGGDVPVGMPFEIVALANPYTDDMSRGLPVRVLFGGAPLPNSQIEIFRKGVSDTQHVETNANGIAMVPISSGEYMLNTVHMVVPSVSDSDRTGAVWHSLWASLTFEVSQN